MATLNRRQREFAQREEFIIDAAGKMLLERGYIGLNMDRIAEATEYSKGTIYQHFTCKEDLIAAVILRTIQVRGALFARAATFPGRSRERLTAIGVADELFYSVYPDHARIEQVTKVESIWDKASDERRNACHTGDTSCMAVVQGVARDAVASGDLVVPQGCTLDDLLFGLWAMSVGARTIIVQGVPLNGFENPDPQMMLHRNFQLFLDGYNWKPFSTEWDYARTIERARQEVFANDIRKAGGSHA